MLLAEVKLNDGNLQVAHALLSETLAGNQLSPLYRYYGHTLLAEYFLNLGALSNAEDHLLVPYQNLQLMVKKRTTYGWFLPRITDRLRRLHERLGKKDEAERWALETRRQRDRMDKLSKQFAVESRE